MKQFLFILALAACSYTFAQPDIKGGEYFLGTIDPGNGNGTAFSVTDGAWDEVVESIVASAQTIPNTTSPILINVRLKDNSNNWGALFKKTLFINGGISNTRSVDISDAEYFFGVFDPGEGQGTPIIAFDGAFGDAVETVLRTNATWTVTNQPTLFNIRMTDAYNNWGPLFKKTIFPYGANPDAELIAEGDTISVCPNSNVTLNYNGPNGYTPTWFNGSNATSITFMVSTIGYYNVTATLGNSTYVDSIYIDFLPAPTPTISPSGAILVCGSSAITLSTPVITNTTYQWYFNGSPIGGSTSANYLPSQAGEYYVAATSTLNGCSGYSDTTILFTTATISQGNPITSCTSPASLSTPFGTGNTYQWNLSGVNIVGETNSTYNATNSGNYSVTVTNGLCTSTSSETSVTINTPPSTPAITAGGTTTFCDGGSVVLTSSSVTGNTWSNGATTQSITVTQGGNYSVTVSNGTCSATSLVTVITVNPVPTTPTISAGGTTTFCDGASVVLTSSSATGNTWSNGETTQSITVTQGGNYSVTVSNGTCSATSLVTAVTVNPVPATPTISAGGTTTFCDGGSVVLTSSSATGNTWSNGATTQSITVTQGGNYSVTVSNGTCSATSLVTVVTVNPVPATPTISAGGTTTFCDGGSVVLTSSSATGNTWSNGAITQSITVTQGGNYSVTVSNGTCSATSIGTAVTVNTVPATPTITAGGITTFCDGGAVVLTSSSATGNTWSTGATTQAITVTQGGNYSVTVSNGTCSATSLVTAVTVNPNPNDFIAINGSTQLCPGESVILTATPNNTYFWSNGSVNESITVNQAGTYFAFITNALGCEIQSQSVQVTQLTVNLNVTQIDDITLQSDAVNGQYQWVDCNDNYAIIQGETNQSFTAVNNGSYAVIVEENGCTDTSSCYLINSVGLDDLLDININIYPNPNRGQFIISSSIEMNTSYSLHDLQGKLIMEGALNGKETIIDIQKLPSGSYSLHIKGDKELVRSIVKI
ncbi:T9SS type A sorting domain-containing protein [Crocinitomicaceae bacterium]|nr:T9SS type A sorting domain-containing protein [Crocinitomicaceae bacterium]